VLRNSPETVDADLLFVKFRRTTDSLLLQPCATNPASPCTHANAKLNGWVEFGIHAAIHWCHSLTTRAVKLPSDKGAPAAKREWEHFDRCVPFLGADLLPTANFFFSSNVAGVLPPLPSLLRSLLSLNPRNNITDIILSVFASPDHRTPYPRYKQGQGFIKPVDECAWPKPDVWPHPPPSLSSFRTPTAATAAGRLGQRRTEGSAWRDWEAAASHPCFLDAASRLADEWAAGAAGGRGGAGGKLAGAEAASVAAWVANEWASTKAEAGAKPRDTAKAGADSTIATRLQAALAAVARTGPAVDARGWCATAALTPSA